MQIFSKLLFGILADFAKSKQVDSDLVTKISNSIGKRFIRIFVLCNLASFVPAVLLLCLNFVEDKTMILILLSVGLAMTAGFVPGYNTSIVTIAPVFTSAISAYAQGKLLVFDIHPGFSGFAQIASVMAPIFVGFATEEVNNDNPLKNSQF